MNKKSPPKKFYINIRKSPEYGVFITVADIDIVERKSFLRRIEYDKIMKSAELKKQLESAVSIIFYGEEAVELGIRLKYVHPEAVGYQEGIKTAIYIKTF